MKSLLLVTSPPACGKTFVSKELAKALNPIVYLDKDTLIVLSSFQDVLSFERVSSHFSYQLLNGVISPSKGISIKDLAIDKLMDRIKEDNFKEVILGLNPDLDGETTSLYLEKVLHEEFPNLKISRLAYGLPMGGNLSYVDDLTLQKAIEGRKIVNE